MNMKQRLLTLHTIIIGYFGLTTAIMCPGGCTCSWFLTNLNVDCSNLDLEDLPELTDLPIESLNLSNNKLTEFPSELADIETLMNLDLSRNQISYIEPNALKGFTSLTKLILDKNNISSWNSISPKRLLLPAVSLKHFSLVENSLVSVPGSEESNILMSRTLTTLDLSNCKISKISGQFFLKGLISIKRLILSDNQIRNFPQIASETLETLELRNCGLTKLQSNMFSDLNTLITLDLSRNPGLNFVQTTDEFMILENLKRLDLSFCNMDRIDLTSFPNLNVLLLKGNMIRKLTEKTFEGCPLLHNLDLSYNSISQIGQKTFSNMEQLRHLDLSFNTIPRVEGNTFKFNKQLITINLSRNFINNFNKIIATSLIHLNLSGCEISSIEHTAFEGMPNIKEVDLSKNFITELPPGLHSESLQNFNLSVCRLTSMNNSTFRFFPALTNLDLSGNRFTSTFKIDYFFENRYLTDIWLGDNPWRCECEDPSFLNFYIYITQNPSKMNDRFQVKCESPANLYGKIWQTACFNIWFPRTNASSAEKIWTIIMVIIITFSMLLCLASTVKRVIENRKKRRNIRERQRYLEEQRSIMRQNRMFLEQEAQINAPDPRESNPPCYEDALLMPKLERNFKSMDELTTRRSKRKIVRSRTAIDMDETDGLILDSIRFRSEEMLSERQTERTVDISSVRRTSDTRKNRSGTRLFSAEEAHFPASYVKAKNLESAEKIASFHSLERSPYSKRKPKLLTGTFPSRSSSSLIGNSIQKQKSSSPRIDRKDIRNSDIIQSFSSIENSPYSRRKPKPVSVSKLSLDINESSGISHRSLNSIDIIDNHFNQISASKSSSDEFQIMNPNDIELVSVHSHKSDISDSYDPVVIVHKN